jgi:hypothetical protein
VTKIEDDKPDDRDLLAQTIHTMAQMKINVDNIRLIMKKFKEENKVIWDKVVHEKEKEKETEDENLKQASEEKEVNGTVIIEAGEPETKDMIEKEREEKQVVDRDLKIDEEQVGKAEVTTSEVQTRRIFEIENCLSVLREETQSDWTKLMLEREKWLFDSRFKCKFKKWWRRSRLKIIWSKKVMRIFWFKIKKAVRCKERGM